jgi:hypothetical protein
MAVEKDYLWSKSRFNSTASLCALPLSPLNPFLLLAMVFPTVSVPRQQVDSQQEGKPRQSAGIEAETKSLVPFIHMGLSQGYRRSLVEVLQFKDYGLQ